MTTTPAARETTVSARGLDLFVRERGEGRPLVMVNGLGGNCEMWGETEARLSRVARTIVFDAPGTGRSATPLRWRSMADLSRVVLAALDELGYDEVDLLGFSLGGLVAQQLANDRPERIRRLALVGTACGWGGTPGTLPAVSLLALPIRYYSRWFYEETNRLISDADGDRDGRLAAQADARLRYPPSLLGYAYQLWAGALFSSYPWLHRVDIPTLVVAGAEDNLVPPANSVQLARLLPQSRLHVVPDEGHLLLFDPTSAGLPLVEDFFSAPALEASQAWSEGTNVVDDDAVEDAFRTSVGMQPYRAMSGAFRRLVPRLA